MSDNSQAALLISDSYKDINLKTILIEILALKPLINLTLSITIICTRKASVEASTR